MLRPILTMRLKLTHYLESCCLPPINILVSGFENPRPTGNMCLATFKLGSHLQLGQKPSQMKMAGPQTWPAISVHKVGLENLMVNSFVQLNTKIFICSAKLVKLCPHLDLKFINWRKKIVFQKNIVLNRWQLRRQTLIDGCYYFSTMLFSLI